MAIVRFGIDGNCRQLRFGHVVAHLYAKKQAAQIVANTARVFVKHARQHPRYRRRFVRHEPILRIGRPLRRHDASIVGQDVVFEAALLGVGFATQKIATIRPQKRKKQAQYRRLTAAIAKPYRRIRRQTR